mmetsp:Transcript_68/g.232  ORF Transcript_68/g.232 Transcript_68/m.232 type:complete len:84 (+) Transcript_68:184-435(+)
MTFALCRQVLFKRTSCTAATYKDRQCWLHDRRAPDWWSDQPDALESYAGDSKLHGLSEPSFRGGVLGGTILFVQLSRDIDQCR